MAGIFKRYFVFMLCVVANMNLFAKEWRTEDMLERQKWFFLETVAGYNFNNYDIPIGLNFTIQRHRFGGYGEIMYGFHNPETRYGFYGSLGLSIRMASEWSRCDSHFYIGPAWRVVRTWRDDEMFEFYSPEQRRERLTPLEDKWGGQFGFRVAGGRAGKHFGVWSGSIGLKIFAKNGQLEFVPQAGLCITIGGALAAGAAVSLFWL